MDPYNKYNNNLKSKNMEKSNYTAKEVRMMFDAAEAQEYVKNIRDKDYKKLVGLRDQLECMEEDTDSVDLVLNNILFCLDDMRGSRDYYDQYKKCVNEAKCVLRGGKLLKVWLQEQLNKK